MIRTIYHFIRRSPYISNSLITVTDGHPTHTGRARDVPLGQIWNPMASPYKYVCFTVYLLSIHTCLLGFGLIR